LLSPSSFLASGINKLVVQKGFVIVPNTVDVTMFSFKERNITRPRFIHVSNMVPLKNVPGILRAFSQLLAIYPDAEMVMVGNKDAAMVDYASSIGLTSSSVRFTGEISYAAVADEM
jgi:glycosyltransferase involved in cell wall biosynthesis